MPPSKSIIKRKLKARALPAMPKTSRTPSTRSMPATPTSRRTAQAMPSTPRTPVAGSKPGSKINVAKAQKDAWRKYMAPAAMKSRKR